MDAEDGLYGLPLEKFVSERDALAKRMRAAGDRQGGARVKGLRKPTVAAWAVNQVARTQRAALRELDESGAALREAHVSLLRGKAGGKELRAASEREREAVEALVTAARGLLSSAGRDLSETVLQDVRDSLHAIATDDETREAVLAGRLDRERRAAGLGGELSFATPVARSPRPSKAKRAPKAAAKRPWAAKPKAKPDAASARRAKEKSGTQAAAAKAAAAKTAAAAQAAQQAKREHADAVARLEAAEDVLKASRRARDQARAAERDARRAREKAAKKAGEAGRRS